MVSREFSSRSPTCGPSHLVTTATKPSATLSGQKFHTISMWSEFLGLSTWMLVTFDLKKLAVCQRRGTSRKISKLVLGERCSSYHHRLSSGDQVPCLRRKYFKSRFSKKSREQLLWMAQYQSYTGNPWTGISVKGRENNNKTTNRKRKKKGNKIRNKNDVIS